MILTVGNTKGGVGKSALAVNIASARALAGRRVALVDADRQGTAGVAMAVRGSGVPRPSLDFSSQPQGRALDAYVRAARERYEDVVIDAGGRDSEALRAALLLSEMLLIPVQPRSYDVWALADIAALAAEAQKFNLGLRCRTVLNLADPISSENREAAEAVADYPHLEHLEGRLVRRKSFSDAAAEGISVFELRPENKKASRELSALLKQIF